MKQRELIRMKNTTNTKYDNDHDDDNNDYNDGNRQLDWAHGCSSLVNLISNRLTLKQNRSKMK